MSPLNARRWRNFKQNRRAKYSLLLFSFLFLFSLFAELIANDKPLLIYFNGSFYWPITSQYSEKQFGGEFETEAEYRSIEVECLIISGGDINCLDSAERTLNEAYGSNLDNWTIWPLIRSSFNTVNYDVDLAPAPPDQNHILGTDDQT